MTLQRGDALDRRIERFLVERADDIARQAAPAAQVAAALASRQGRRSVDRPRLVLALALLLVGAVVVGLIGALQRAHGGAIGPIPGNLTWSPDGSLLAFSTLAVAPRPDGPSGPSVERAIDIWLVQADGTGLRRLARDIDDPTGFRTGAAIAWSPDGRYVAYGLPFDNVTNRFAIQAIDATARTELTGLPAAWSPVDDRLLVQLDSAAGSELVLVSVLGDSTPITSSGGGFGGLWSPDGSRILFTDGVVDGAQTPSSSIVVANADGSGARRLGVCCDLGWAPDGSAIYYLADTRALRRITPDGTDDRLVANAFDWYGWSWDPDGSRYVTPVASGLQVATPGTAPETLTTGAGDTEPSWSPDGAWVAFWGSREGGSGGFVVPAAGGTPTLVAPSALGTSRLAWRPRTDSLAFIHEHQIELVSADGTGNQVIVETTALGGRPDDSPTASAQRIIIGPDGPDHDTYRVPAAPAFELVVENTTSDDWRIDLAGFDILTGDCRRVEQGDISLVAYVAPSRAPGLRQATPPDFCAVPPRAVVKVAKPQLLGGSVLISVTRTSTGFHYPVILEFGP